MKDIIDDIKDISLDLVDNGFKVEIEPSNDIQVKITSLRTNRTPFFIRVKNFKGYLLPFHVDEVKEIFERIIEYANSKGIDCDFFVSKPTHSRQSREFLKVSGTLPDIGNPKNIMWAQLNFTFPQNDDVFEGLKYKKNWYDYLRTVSFEELPYEYQKSLMIYMYEGDAVDWSISISLDKVAKDDKLIKILINDYISVGRNKHKSFAYGLIPIDVLKRDVTDRLGWDSFEEYHKWYIKDK